MSDMEFYIYRLGDLFSRFSSGKNLTSDKISPEGIYPVYGGNGLRGYTAEYNFEGECIIIGRQGAKCGNIHYFNGKGYMTDHAIVGVSKKEHDSRFLSYALTALDLNRLSGQAAQPGLAVSMLKKQKIELPSSKNQFKIAEIISIYDKLIENNIKRIRLLEQMAENLYKEWFVRFRFPEYEDVEFEEKKPRGWQVGTEDKKHFAPTIFRYDKLGTIGSFVRGKNITAAQMIEGNIPVISAGLKPSGYHNQANVLGENLTISASGANAGYLQYNLNDIWAADCSYYQDNTTIWFVYNTLKYLQPVISNLQCGAAQPHVYPKNINRLYILIPTEELIHKYNDSVKPYYDEIKVLNQYNQLLTQQRDMLLPRLMSGKLEV